jgi:hypothetical protein
MQRQWRERLVRSGRALAPPAIIAGKWRPMRSMSLMGHKRRFDHLPRTSGVAPITDSRRHRSGEVPHFRE